MNAITDLSPAMLAALGALVALQLVLQVTALVNLARMPASCVSLGGRKWVWVIVIIVGEIIGPIVYFAAGRLPAPAQEQAATPSSGRAQAAADTLYGHVPVPLDKSAKGVDPAVGDAGTQASSGEVGADGTGMGELP